MFDFFDCLGIWPPSVAVLRSGGRWLSEKCG
nr:MAG TPA: hypothetical protein [Caudoviricetes sp.]